MSLESREEVLVRAVTSADEAVAEWKEEGESETLADQAGHRFKMGT